MSNESVYRISHAARLSGVSADTIRIWERRYAAVEPGRDGSNMRVYSAEDVQRLGLMRRLIDAGARISDIAGLDAAALQGRLAESAPPVVNQPGVGRIPVVLVGPGLAALAAEISELQVDGRFDSLAAMREHGRLSAATTLVLRQDQLGENEGRQLLATLRELGLRRALLLYEFAPSAVLGRLRSQGVMSLRATSDPGELRHVLLARHYWEYAGRADAQDHLVAPIPAPRYAAADLERARALKGQLACECPRHLADLISALSAFEAYSSRCEQTQDSDAAVHAMLHSAAAHARHTMETALARLAADEGLTAQLENPAS